MKNLLYFLFGCLAVACKSNQDRIDFVNPDISEEADLVVYGNTILAHKESDTILGNFIGNSIDTLWVKTVANNCEHDENEYYYGENVKYYLTSKKPEIPDIELYGYSGCQPRIVYEGDLDGNGIDEVGYLHTWMNSQWRTYRIFTLVNGEWRYLLNNWEFLSTSERFRESGVEVAEYGSPKGLVKINYMTDYPNCEIRDTMLIPSFSIIDDKPQ